MVVEQSFSNTWMCLEIVESCNPVSVGCAPTGKSSESIGEVNLSIYNRANESDLRTNAARANSARTAFARTLQTQLRTVGIVVPVFIRVLVL